MRCAREQRKKLTSGDFYNHVRLRFAARGLRTLLVDLDPQASATDFFGLYDRAASEPRTLARS